MKTTGNTILLTGGGSGIGAALAHRLSDLGNVVLVAGRRLDVLQEAARGRDTIIPVQCDIDDAAGVAALAAQVVKDYPALNVLINNAGIMRAEKLEHKRDLSDAEAMITTNLLGPIRLIDALIDHLSTQADAVIINNTSGLAFVPFLIAPTYSATKAALHSYTVSLREVLRGKVEVIEIAPPAVQTTLTPGQESRAGYQPLAEFADEVMSLLVQKPTPAEILVQRVQFLRFAERDGQVDNALAVLAGLAAAH